MPNKTRTAAQQSADKRRSGRPPMAPEDRRSRPVMVYLTESEHARLAGLAEQEGITLGSLILRPWRDEGA